MSSGRDYTKDSFRITFLVIAILLIVSLVPPFSIGGVNFKRANILSDIITYSDSVDEGESELNESDKEFIEESRDIEGRQIEPVPLPEEAAPFNSLDLDTGIAADAGQQTDGAREEAAANIDMEDVVKIEDYTPGGRLSVGDLSRTIEDKSRRRVVRIAFLGDSFIEGDIITADVREQLQDIYGGEGVGFVPFGNPLAISRPTVRHESSGWANYNLINKRSAPQEWREKFFVSGALNVPSSGARAKYSGVPFRRHLSSWSRARIVFLNEGTVEITVVVNDTITRNFIPEASDAIQQVVLNGQGMKSLRVTVNNPHDFVGYGVVFDSPTGVSVDNYAVRSNSGIALFGTSGQVNAQIGAMLGYDLIVLQYGLNAISTNVTNYTAYGEQLRRVINYIKSCFPNSAIIVMGVGDRSTMRNGRLVTMPAVRAMVAEQRAAAKECGVAFWDMFIAMGGQNSMAKFVEWNWAAKDYTHLSHRGGKHIASEFVKALLYAKFANGADSPEDYLDSNNEAYTGRVYMRTAADTTASSGGKDTLAGQEGLAGGGVSGEGASGEGASDGSQPTEVPEREEDGGQAAGDEGPDADGVSGAAELEGTAADGAVTPPPAVADSSDGMGSDVDGTIKQEGQ